LDVKDADADASFWLLMAEDGASVMGVVANDSPALALFATMATAETFIREAGVPAHPQAASTGSLIAHWLLIAFSAGWDAAIMTDDGGSGAVKPVRLALDLAHAAHETEDG
jgi:hypothetical protein